MFPSVERFDPSEPGVDGRPVGTGEPEGLRVKEVATAGQIRIGDAASGDPVTLRQPFLENLQPGKAPALQETR